MAFIRNPDRWLIPPQGPVEIDWQNDITRGLVVALTPYEGVRVRNLATEKMVAASNAVVGMGRTGMVFQLSGQQINVAQASELGINAGMPLSIVYRAVHTNNNWQATYPIFGCGAGGVDGWIFRPRAELELGDGIRTIHFMATKFGIADVPFAGSPGPLKVGRGPQTAGMSYANSTWRTWAAGRLYQSVSSGGYSAPAGNRPLYWGVADGGAFVGEMDWGLLYRRALLAEEWIEFEREPYAFLKQRITRTIYLPATSAGETVVGAGGSLHPIGIGAVGLARGMSAIEYGSPT